MVFGVNNQLSPFPGQSVLTRFSFFGVKSLPLHKFMFRCHYVLEWQYRNVLNKINLHFQ